MRASYLEAIRLRPDAIAGGADDSGLVDMARSDQAMRRRSGVSLDSLSPSSFSSPWLCVAVSLRRLAGLGRLIYLVSTYAAMEGTKLAVGRGVKRRRGERTGRAASSCDAPCQDMLKVVLHAFV